MAMADPRMVYIREYEVEVLPGTPKYAVAHISTDEEGMSKYVEVLKNRVFYSKYPDSEMAYNEFLDQISETKETNVREIEMKRSHQLDDMITVMKCCMVAYGEVTRDCQMAPKSYDQIKEMFTNTPNAYLNVMPGYFGVGIAANIVVNEAKSVFDQCVKNEMKYIMDIIMQKSRFTERESMIYAMTCDYFQPM